MVRSFSCVLLLAFFLYLRPSPTFAVTYTIPPDEFTPIVFENLEFFCSLRFSVFDQSGSLLYFYDVQAGYEIWITLANPPVPFPESFYFSGEIYFAYEPLASGPTCPPPGVITSHDPGVVLHHPALGSTDDDYQIAFPSGVNIYIVPEPVPPPEPPPEIFHPVIFVHGTGGKPTDWTTGNKKAYWEQLLQAGYPEYFLATYSFADADGNPDTYDYQGDITKIVDDFPALADEMAQRFEDEYRLGCNNECVDAVGFSLGGLVIRQYLNEHPLTNKIRKVVTIGTPHEGSQFVAPIAWANSIPFVGGLLREAVVGVFNAASEAWGLIDDVDQVLAANSPATIQQRPGSTFLGELNSFVYESTPAFHAIAGDIDAAFRQSLFHFRLVSGKFSIGDIVVSKPSALAIPTTGVSKKVFSDEAITVIGDVFLERIGNIYQYSVDLPYPGELKYWHLNLAQQPEIVEYVVGRLNNE